MKVEVTYGRSSPGYDALMRFIADDVATRYPELRAAAIESASKGYEAALQQVMDLDAPEDAR